MINTDQLLRELQSLRDFEEKQGIFRTEITYADVVDIVNRLTQDTDVG